MSDDTSPSIPEGYDPGLYRIRHSAAHVLAEAVGDYFDRDVRFAIGPPIERGFYYDFELPRPLTDDDLGPIEDRMKEIIAGDHPFTGRAIEPEEALAMFSEQPFKKELIEDLISTADGAPPEITVYNQDTFTDLCRGPHVNSTGDIPAIKLLSVAGAYWRGDEHRPMLQRIYGTAFASAKELETELERRAEAERRDHRRLGRELELFHLDPRAPGMPYWLPNGLKLFNALIEFWRDEHEQRGYREISAPLINEKSLWEISGHWSHYVDNMFVIPVDEHTTYAVKPMNCPNAMIVYNLKTRSYRDLPLRLSDCDVLHRHERSGALHGLLRVQKFTQDDAHIFCTEEQIADEYRQIFEICDLFYGLFGLTYRFRLGTRPDDYIGDPAVWERAEATLERILEAQKADYWIEHGDGAFYGPKIDIMMDDALGRSWQMGTLQLDFQLPGRFGCTYVDANDTEQTPVVIHRVIYGSLERFIGILIEHTGGVFPAWLAPVQAQIIPVMSQHVDAANEVAQRLRAARIRHEVDASDRRLGAKIREAQVMKVPWMLVIGDREVESGQVAVRRRTGEQQTVPLDEFIAEATRIVAARTQD